MDGNIYISRIIKYNFIKIFIKLFIHGLNTKNTKTTLKNTQDMV
jgi:hypothetical protein